MPILYLMQHLSKRWLRGRRLPYKDDTEPIQKLWSGVMDVVYRQGEQWHIVDYKTNADGNDLDNKYRNQLDAYIKAFKATTGETADARTYHIDV